MVGTKITSKQFWLMKSEASVYSIEDLARDKTTLWDGVRNYQARNFLRDQIKKSDLIFFYHSNSAPSGIAGVAQVVREGYPDPSAFNSQDVHYDPKSTKDMPVWFAVDIRFVRKLKRLLSLAELKKISGLKSMTLLKRGRLSVQPVTENEWRIILGLAGVESHDL